MKTETIRINDGNCIVTAELTPQTKELIVARIIKFCEEYQCYSGESLYQRDITHQQAPEVLSEIIDELIKFNVEFI